MNCPKCGCEMFVSHIQKKVENGKETATPVYVCMNQKCSEYSENSYIKIKKADFKSTATPI